MRLRLLIGLGVAVISVAGCCHFKKNDPVGGWRGQPVYPGSPAAPMPSGGNPETLMPTTPGGAAPALPPPSTSGFGAPSGMWVAPPHAHPGVPPSLLPPARTPVDNRFYFAPPGGRTPTIAPRIETREPPLAPVKPPPPIENKSSDTGTRTVPPALVDPNPLPKPPAIPDPVASPTLPVGIPAYVEVKSGVSTGWKPDPEGLDWVKSKGYRAVLHLRKPGTPNTADEEQVQKRGLKYLSLEVSPETLTAALRDQFNTIVADSANRALFVYDKDGTLAGALWYLHFRSVDKVPAESARLRAERFGLKAADTGEHAALWIAIQKIAIP